MTESKQISREMITETAALLIEETGDRKSVTLREIAKRLGCAHTNLYNYYGSLNEIWWDAAAWILMRMMDETREETASDVPPLPESPERDVLCVFLKFFDFSVDHPGWYRFLWLEKQEGTPSPEAVRILSGATESTFTALSKIAGDSLAPDRIRQLSDIMFCYTYGEITSWIHNRRSHESRDAMKQRLADNLKLLYSLFMKENIFEQHTREEMQEE